MTRSLRRVCAVGAIVAGAFAPATARAQTAPPDHAKHQTKKHRAPAQQPGMSDNPSWVGPGFKTPSADRHRSRERNMVRLRRGHGELPVTGSDAPLVALFGAGLLCVGAGLRRRLDALDAVT